MTEEGVSNVWCVITPPDYDDETDLQSVKLNWTANYHRYEALYSDFKVLGTYTLTFQAQNASGEWSEPIQSEIILPDRYEPDNTNGEANAFVVGETQRHNFHHVDDVDWVQFFAATGFTYQIDADWVGTNVNCVLDAYYETPADGRLIHQWRVDNKGIEETETAYLDISEPGMYYIQVSSPESTSGGESTEYDLHIWVPAGDVVTGLTVSAQDILNPQHSRRGPGHT